jgi:hypothetical protein
MNTSEPKKRREEKEKKEKRRKEKKQRSPVFFRTKDTSQVLSHLFLFFFFPSEDPEKMKGKFDKLKNEENEELHRFGVILPYHALILLLYPPFLLVSFFLILPCFCCVPRSVAIALAVLAHFVCADLLINTTYGPVQGFANDKAST